MGREFLEPLERFSDFYDHFLFKVLVQNHDISNISEINADILKKKLDRDFFTPVRPSLKFKIT